MLSRTQKCTTKVGKWHEMAITGVKDNARKDVSNQQGMKNKKKTIQPMLTMLYKITKLAF